MNIIQKFITFENLIIGLKFILSLIIGSTIGSFLLGCVLYFRAQYCGFLYKISFKNVIQLTKNVFISEITGLLIMYMFVVVMSFTIKFIMNL